MHHRMLGSMPVLSPLRASSLFPVLTIKMLVASPHGLPGRERAYGMQDCECENWSGSGKPGKGGHTTWQEKLPWAETYYQKLCNSD